MDKNLLLNNIREFKDTPLVRYFSLLLDMRVQELRIKNDTATSEEVLRNQGAITELKSLRKQLGAVEKFDEKDGAYI